MTTMAQCSECGAKMSVKRGNYLYDQETGGLPVTLEDVEVCTCAACGARDAIVPRIPALNQAIVGALTRKRGRLSGAEVRFLRASIGRSGRELAALMGARPETVSRWESVNAGIGTHPDKLLRLIAAVTSKDHAYGEAEIEAAASEDWSDPLRFTLTPGRTGWRVSGEVPATRHALKVSAEA